MNVKTLYTLAILAMSIAFAQGANSDAFGAMTGMIMAMYCIFGIIGLICIIIWLWILVDAIQRKNYDKDSDKLLWVLIIVFAGIVGAALYYFLIKRKKDADSKTSKEGKK